MTRSTMLAHEAVERQATERPDELALVCGEVALTYAQLVGRAHALARRLRARGVGTGDIVGMHVERSADVVVGLLGILFSGAAYLPLDPEHPPARRALVLADARPALVISRAPVDGAAWLPLDAEEDGTADAAELPDIGPEDLAYVLYTSGSTGTPKGVMVDHAALAARVDEMTRVFGIGPGDRTTQFAAVAWDASLFDTLLGICTGATLHVLRASERVPGPGLVHLLRERRITAAFIPPSVLAAMPEADLPDLRALFVGGEACRAPLVDRWARGRAFYNLYGPTETTIWCTTERCEPHVEPTIGRPLRGGTARILDPAADGLGEICIGGAGLARGYLHRPELTRERFVTIDGERFYRTGDVGRLLPDGRLECHGRLDDQVKVRGVRVELGEVEAAIARHPDVRDVAVLAAADARGEKRLVAYIARDEAPAVARRASPELREAWRVLVAQHLPAASVPSFFIEMPALPLNATGKIDRAALPPLDAILPTESAALPRTEMERIVADVWREVLGVPAVGLHDAFFDVGGHSLLVADVQSRLSAALGREVDIVVLFEHATIASLARHLSGASATPVGVPVRVQGAAERGEARRAARSRPARANGGEPR